MTKKDFQLIADTIRELPFQDTKDLVLTAEEFAKKLAQTNPAFDYAKFMKACGV